MPENLAPGASDSFSAAEIAALKELARAPERPWWGDYPFLVAALAFLLSLTTSVISAYVAHSRDVHAEEAQLAAAVGSIQELNLRQVELHEKYKGSPYEGQATALLTNEVNSVLDTATSLALKLGSKAHTADLTAVALGLYGVGRYQESHELLRDALTAAQSAADKSAALRYLGLFEIRSHAGPKAVKKGEDYFQRALNLAHRGDVSGNPTMAAWLGSSAEFGWASAMASINCTIAQQHFREGVELILHAPKTIDLEQERDGVKRQWTRGIGGVSGCLPDARTPPLP